jgi:hypothetical protein
MTRVSRLLSEKKNSGLTRDAGAESKTRRKSMSKNRDKTAQANLWGEKQGLAHAGKIPTGSLCADLE